MRAHMESRTCRETIPLLFSGYNPRAVLAFVRKMSQLNIQDYHIIAASASDEILETSYIDHVSYIRKNKPLDLDELLSCIDTLIHPDQTGLIIPSTEALNRFVLKHRSRFESHRCIIPLVTEELYCKISDKKPFWELCRSSDFDVPARISPPPCFSTPFVLKPASYHLGNTIYPPVPVLNEDDFQANQHLFAIDGMEAYEYIEDNSFYLMMYLTRDGMADVFFQKNLAQQPGGKSMVAAKAWGPVPEGLDQRYIDFLRGLGFYGFIMIELRLQQNKYYMIEANPRMWGPSQLLVDAGSTIFESFLKEYRVINNYEVSELNMEARYYWEDGFSDFETGLCFLNNGKEELSLEQDAFRSYDLYNRNDTHRLFGKNRE